MHILKICLPKLNLKSLDKIFFLKIFDKFAKIISIAIILYIMNTIKISFYY